MDIGGGTTEIAVIALGGIVCDKSVKIAGDVFTNDIIYYMRTQHNLFVGETTAEKIKITVGSATDALDTPPDDMSVQGRDLLTGKPKQVEVSFREIAKALDKSIQRIEDKLNEMLSLYNSGKLGLDAEREKMKDEVTANLKSLEQLIMPLLVNLMKNPEKEYIYWPNRTAKIQEQIDKVLTLTRG